MNSIDKILIDYIARKADILAFEEVVEMLVPKRNEYVYIFYMNKDKDVPRIDCVLIIQHIHLLRKIAEKYGNLDSVTDNVLKTVVKYE